MNKHFITFLFAVFFTIGTFVSIKAQTIQVNAQFDSTAIWIGDQIKLHIEMERQNDVRVQFPVWTDTLARKIEIIEAYPVDSSRTADGIVHLKQDILVTSFDEGRHVLSPILFPFVTADGIADTIATRPIYLDVFTMPLDSTQNIADIKPVYKLPLGWVDIYPWLLRIGLLLLIIALIVFAIYAYIRRRNNKPIFSAPKPAEPPHIIALRELDKLRTEKLWQNNRTKDYYTRLSDIVRTYIEGRFCVNAMEMTSDEILAGLQHTGFEDNNLVDRLHKLFSLADLVKFAKAQPFPDENETSMLDGYLFVNNTKIEVVSEQSDAGQEDDADKVKTADFESPQTYNMKHKI
jgi:hypothetical protein